MRVRVNENIKLFQGHVPVRLAKDMVVTGELAALLVERAPTKVTRLDDPEQDGRDPGDPPPSDELDITASVGKVLDWVGDNSERAVRAQAAEQATEHPRATLLKQLSKLTEQG